MTSSYTYKGRCERRAFRAGILLAAAVALADQASKWAALSHPELASAPLPVIPGLFHIVLTHNTGAAWGMFKGNSLALFAVSLAVMAGLCWFFRPLTEGWPERHMAVFAIAGGVVGNSIDRVFRGAVVDFLDFQAAGWHWPAFNVADSAICLGVAVITLSALLRPPSPAA